MPRAPAAPARSPWPRRLAWGLSALLLLGLAGGLAAWHCRDRLLPPPPPTAFERTADEVIASFQKGLPKEFGPGLTLVAVRRDGPDVVFIIASDKRTAVDAHRDPAALEQVRDRERLQLLETCDIPDMARLLATGMRMHRLFVDRNGSVFFDVSLTADDCRARVVPPLAESRQ